MGLSSSNPPPAPKYDKLEAAAVEQMQRANNLADEQFAWAKETYAKDMELLAPVIESSMARMQQFDQWAQEDRARWETMFKPVEDRLIQDSMEYDSPWRKEQEAGRSQAATAQALEQQKRQSEQQLQSYGIDPSSIRYNAIDRAASVTGAAATAAAGNEARRDVEKTGMALRADVANMGRGTQQQAVQTGNAAGAQGAGGANTALSGTASGASTMGTAGQYMGSAGQALGQWGNIVNAGYSNQLDAWKAGQNSSSGWGSALGTAAGAALSFFEDGGLVPEEASPTRGAATDDVPAALNVGEFVFPEEAVRWIGEKQLQNMVAKAEKERNGPKPAQPDVKMALPQEPTYRTALPA